MKKFGIVILFALATIKGYSQTPNTDSLWQKVQITNNDSLKFKLLQDISNHCSSSIELTLIYAKRELTFGEKHNDQPCKAFGYMLYAFLYNRLGEYIKAQEAIIKASIMTERMPNNENYAAVLLNLKGTNETNTTKAIQFLQKGLAVCKDDFRKSVLLYNLASRFYSLKKNDSALSYAQKSNELRIKLHDSLSVFIPVIFGRIHLSLKQPDIALAYFKEGVSIAEKDKEFKSYQVAYFGMVTYYTSQKKQDSVISYLKKIFTFQSPESYSSKVGAAESIYRYYLELGNKDSLIKYLLFTKTGNDSLRSTRKIEELQQAKIREELRQSDLAISKEEETTNRNHNIQLAFIAVGILSIIIIFLLLSNSFIVSHKVVGFLSVLVLLVVFEFINLLIHPFLEKITHHSPVLMLLGLVAIAALIIPLHHKLAHWATNKLVEKNKAIRLAQAKKTIEELEGKKGM